MLVPDHFCVAIETRDRMPGHENEIAVGKYFVEESGFQDVAGRFFDQNGFFEIPVATPLALQGAFVFFGEKRRGLGKMSRRIEGEAARSAMRVTGRKNRLKVLAFVLYESGIGEGAHIGVLSKDARQKRGAGPLQPAYQDVTRRCHGLKLGRRRGARQKSEIRSL